MLSFIEDVFGSYLEVLQCLFRTYYMQIIVTNYNIIITSAGRATRVVNYFVHANHTDSTTSDICDYIISTLNGSEN